MFRNKNCRRAVLWPEIIALAVIFLPVFSPVQAEPILSVHADSVYVCAMKDSVIIPVYLKNLTDIVQAFEIWIILSRPDLIQFTGTTFEMVDTAGTLTSGWGMTAHSLGDQGYDIHITGAPRPEQPGIIPPQYGQIPLLRLIGRIYDIPDTTTDTTVNLYIQHENLDHFCFSDPQGHSIGIYTDTVIDTAFYRCLQWAPPPNDNICLLYEHVSGPPFDSIFVDTFYVGRLDTLKTEIIDGLVGVLHPGDANCNRILNIQDITYLISFLYKSGPAPIPFRAGDADADGIVNIRDITHMINYLYRAGPSPICN